MEAGPSMRVSPSGMARTSGEQSMNGLTEILLAVSYCEVDHLDGKFNSMD